MRPLSVATAKIFAPIGIPENNFVELSVTDDFKHLTASFWGQDARFSSVMAFPHENVVKFVSRIPEQTRLTSGFGPYIWNFGASDYTVELFATLWPLNQLYFANEETRTVYESILYRSNFADYCAEVYANFKERKLVPPHDYEYDAENPLSPYQQVALYNAMASEGFALFMEPGTGKTPVSIATVCNLVRTLSATSSRMFRNLIVCPKNVRMNWENEFAKFSTRNGKVTVLRGADIGRVKQLIDALTRDETSQFTSVVCSYETMVKSWEALSMIPWDLSILDEAHYIKSTRTKRYEYAIKLRDISERRLILTGTPITNTFLDLYGQLEFLGEGYSGFVSEKEFRSFYGVFEQNDSGFESLVGVQNLPFIQERLARHSFIISLQEALPDLPEKVYDIYEIEMTPQQQECYSELSEKLMVQIEAELSRDNMPRSMIVSCILTQLLRLAQITSGFMVWDATYSDDGDILGNREIEYFEDAPNPKIEGVLDLLEPKGPDDKTIIWACWKPDLAYLQHALTEAGHRVVMFHGGTSDADRAEAEFRFNNDNDCNVFIGNQAAGGTGLNLLGYPPGNPDATTTNCNHIIYYSQGWSSTQRGQSEQRANRRGTRVPTRITDLVVPRTIDEEIRARVITKQKHALEVSDIRSILSNVLHGVRQDV